MLAFYLSLIDDEKDKQKFEQIYYQYRNLMYHIAERILNNRQDAEDAVQTAFFKIADNIDKISDNDCHKIKAFVVIVVERTAINYYNKRKKRQSISYDDISYNIPSETEIDETVINRASAAELLKRISELPVKYCEALTLKYVHGLSGKEIAKIIGISHPAARKRIERGLEILNIKIKEAE